MTDYDHAEQLKNLALIEASFGPLRKRVVVAEALCEAVLETMDEWTSDKVKAALQDYLKLRDGP